MPAGIDVTGVTKGALGSPDVAAAMGVQQLARLPAFVQRRQYLAQRYHAEAEALRASSVVAKEYRVLAGGKAWRGFEKLVEGERRASEKPRKGSGKGK